MFAVTLRPPIPPGPSGDPGTQPPDCIEVKQDYCGNVVIREKQGGYNNGHNVHPLLKKILHAISQWKKNQNGHYSYDNKGSHGGSSSHSHHGGSSGHSNQGGSSGGSSGGHGGNCGGSGGDDCKMGVAVIENCGTLVVTETSTGATWDVTNARSVKIIGTSENDDIFYTGNSIGAEIESDGGDDAITIADTGSGRSRAEAGMGNDSMNLLIGNYTYLNGGSGNDTIYVNSGGGIYNTNAGEAIVDAGSGNDTIVMYAGKAWIDGQSGNDVVLKLGGNASVQSATVQS